MLCFMANPSNLLESFDTVNPMLAADCGKTPGVYEVIVLRPMLRTEAIGGVLSKTAVLVSW